MKLKGLFCKKETGIYYYQPPQKKGYRASIISLRTKDKDEAIKKYLEVSQNAQSLIKPAALAFEVERFHKAKTKSKRHTADSSRGSKYVLKLLIDRLGKRKNIASITTADLKKWKDELDANERSSATIRTYFGRLSSFFAWAIKEGVCTSNPVNAIELPKTIASRSERYCTRAEREALLAACPEKRDDLALILHVGFFAGLRVSEIIEMRPDWIDLQSGTLTIQNTPTFTTKDKRHRIIRMSPRLTTFLTEYGMREPFMLRPDKKHGQKITHHKDKKTTAWRYRYDPRRPFKKLAVQCDLPWVSFHTMRHTFATLHALAGTPLTTIAREMGDDERTTYHNYVGHSRHSEHAAAID
ncbi:MAG: site-specific integrase [Verrucomicrobiota bacterium]